MWWWLRGGHPATAIKGEWCRAWAVAADPAAVLKSILARGCGLREVPCSNEVPPPPPNILPPPAAP